MKKLAIMVAVLLTCTAPAHSGSSYSLVFDGGTEAIIAFQNRFNVRVHDQVDGDCLPNPDGLANVMRSELTRLGLSVPETEDPKLPEIVITSVGFPVTPDRCVVNLAATLDIVTEQSVPYSDGGTTFASSPIQFGSTLIYYSKRDMQQELENESRKFASDLSLKIAGAKEHVRSKFPSIYRNYPK